MLAPTGTSQIKWDRWLTAQEYEQAYWRSHAESIDKGTVGQLDWYDWRARQLEARLASLPNPRPKSGRILEIGSGPIGIVNSLGWGERYAIDPLEWFYRQTPSLVKLRRPGTIYLSGAGETLPLEDASCGLVIIENVIDHTYAPTTIMREISRVLEPGGELYLLVNVHTRWGAFLHNLLAALHIDRGHPYTFTSASLRRFIERCGFTIALEEIGSYHDARREDRGSPNAKAKLKGYSGLSEFQHAVICRKQP